MYFLLHHSTGTLLLSADDRNTALSWSERQLGSNAKRAAVLELDVESAPEWVERSGTGMTFTGCEAFLSVMADSIRRVNGDALDGINRIDWLRRPESVRCQQSIH